MTHVSAKCCETCCYGVAEWNSEHRLPDWYCEKDQLGNEECEVYEREPGAEG